MMFPPRRAMPGLSSSDTRDSSEDGSDETAILSAALQPGSFWAVITGQLTGTNQYAWAQVDEGDTVSFGAGLADSFEATGTSAATGGCAYEINGSQTVPADGSVRVRMWPGGDLTYYIFSFSPGDLTSPLTTKGDLWGFGTANARTPVGTDGQVLTADSTAPNGVSYQTPAALALSWKAPVVAATTAPGTLASSFANGSVVDGVTLATGRRVLIKNQSSAAENGLYTVNASGAPTRSTDANTVALLYGAATVVVGGSQIGTEWACTVPASATLGTSAIPWVQIGGGGTSPLTTKGDIWIYASPTGNTRLPVAGVNGMVLQADSTVAEGLSYGGLSNTWAPTFSGLTTTGTLTTHAFYATVGRCAFFTVSLSATTISASAGATMTLPVGVGTNVLAAASVVSLTASNTVTDRGHGAAGVFGNLILPAWASSSDEFVISGHFFF